MSHISFSELKNWNFCPFYHKLTYIDKLKGFTGNAFTAFGTAIHDVCEKKILKESFNEEEFFLKRFQECLDELDSNVLDETEDKLMQDMAIQGVEIIPKIIPALDKYFKDGYEVLSSEEDLMVNIKNTETNFKGFIDAVIKTPDGKIHIIDWKSTSWGWDARRKADKMTTYQLVLYKIFYSQKHDIPIENIETHFALLKRTAKKDRVEIFKVTSGQKRIENASSLLTKALFNIKKKNYIKDKRSCSRCEFKGTKHCP